MSEQDVCVRVITVSGADISERKVKDLDYSRWMGTELDAHPIDGDASMVTGHE